MTPTGASQDVLPIGFGSQSSADEGIAERRLLFRSVQVNSVAPFAQFSITSSASESMPVLGQIEFEPQEVLWQRHRRIDPRVFSGWAFEAWQSNANDVSSWSPRKLKDAGAVEFTPGAVALLKTVDTLDDAKDFAADLYRIVPGTTCVHVKLAVDPEFSDATMNFAVHTSAAVDDVMAADDSVNDCLFQTETYRAVPEVVVTYEFEDQSGR